MYMDMLVKFHINSYGNNIYMDMLLKFLCIC